MLAELYMQGALAVKGYASNFKVFSLLQCFPGGNGSKPDCCEQQPQQARGDVDALADARPADEHQYAKHQQRRHDGKR